MSSDAARSHEKLRRSGHRLLPVGVLGAFALAIAGGVTSHGAARAEDGALTLVPLARQAVMQGQRSITMEIPFVAIPHVLRVTSGDCTTPVDQAMVVQGELHIDGPERATATLTPLGEPAKLLNMDSRIDANALMEVRVVREDIVAGQPPLFRFPVRVLTIQLSRENGFPNIPTLTVCVG